MTATLALLRSPCRSAVCRLSALRRAAEQSERRIASKGMPAAAVRLRAGVARVSIPFNARKAVADSELLGGKGCEASPGRPFRHCLLRRPKLAPELAENPCCKINNLSAVSELEN